MKRNAKRPPVPDRLPVQVDDCPCTQVRCHRHGNCVECIRVHRTRQEHIPECLQEMFRVHIGALAGLVEYGTLDLRRTSAYWDNRLGKERSPSRLGEQSGREKKPSQRRKALRKPNKRDSSRRSAISGK